MFAGGGFSRGLIHGSSDRIGAYPASKALAPGDVISTLYRTLGIRHDRQVHDRLARPHRLVPEGQVVTALLG